ncbi:MAG: hypothetical protein U9P42_01920 [Candidatus Fermentibacteria bacterium]|nr:hypothetical protein [Candidatus Fermentibacteria bacterium]
MDNFVKSMREKILPDCFELKKIPFYFEDRDEFMSMAGDTQSFLSYVQRVSGFLCEGCYSDVFYSGFLGSYAFALWFMEFDQDNWFSFEDVLTETKEYLNSYSSVAHRRELRLIKGSFSPMNLDLPVVVDYENLTVAVWTGELRD